MIDVVGKIAISTVIEKYKNNNREKLLEKLRSGKINIDSEIVHTDYFISSFLKTEEAIQKAESQGKFDFLSSLYISCLENDLILKEPITYHEVISSLGDMSQREIYFLYLLDKYRRDNNEEKLGFESFNNGLAKMYAEKMGYNLNDVRAITNRLLRTGFVVTVQSYGGDWPRVSSLYKNVLDLIHYSWDNVRFIS